MIIISLKKVDRLYTQGGFIARVIFMDMEFEKVKRKFELIEVDTNAARKNAP